MKYEWFTKFVMQTVSLRCLGGIQCTRKLTACITKSGPTQLRSANSIWFPSLKIKGARAISVSRRSQGILTKRGSGQERLKLSESRLLAAAEKVITIHEITRNVTKQHEQNTSLLVLFRFVRVVSWIASLLDRFSEFSAACYAALSRSDPREGGTPNAVFQ